MRHLIALCAAALLLAGCATRLDPNDPARAGQSVSFVNSLGWTHALSGKPDGMRTAWPLDAMRSEALTEEFPLAQVKQCDATGAICRWGIVKARRTAGPARFVPGGVALELELAVNVDRHQEVRRPDLKLAMSIPVDVSALRSERVVKRALVLEYGIVHQIELDYGISFKACVQRLDAARQPVDQCAIAYF
jgi:hypothetical protein